MLCTILASAVALGGRQNLSDPPPKFPVVLLGPGDMIVRADSPSTVVQPAIGAGQYLLCQMQKNYRLITAPSDPAPIGSLAKNVPALVLFGDGHVLIVLGGTTLDYSEPQGDSAGSVYLQSGTVTLADTDFSPASVSGSSTKALVASRTRSRSLRLSDPQRVSALSTKIVIRTHAVTTGAKGCLLTVQYSPKSASGTAIIWNYETNECTLNRGDVYVSTGAKLLARCNQATVAYSSNVSTPIVTQPISNAQATLEPGLARSRGKRHGMKKKGTTSHRTH